MSAPYFFGYFLKHGGKVTMNKTVVINGKTYNTVNDCYEVMVEFEDYGINIMNMEKSLSNKPLTIARGYLCVISGLDSKSASKEIMEHMKKGGSLEDLLTCFYEVVEDFFRNLDTTSEEETPKKTTTKKQATK